MHVHGSIGHLHNVACRPKTLNNNASGQYDKYDNAKHVRNLGGGKLPFSRAKQQLNGDK